MEKIIKGSVVAICLVLIFFIGKSKLAGFYYNRGTASYERQLYKEAADYFNKAIRIYPSVATIHYALANAYREEGVVALSSTPSSL